MRLQNCCILFILYMIINSDVFTDNILSTFGGTVDGRDITTFGAMLQALTLILFYAVLTQYLK